MKNITLAFLCCSAFLAACDNSSDTTTGSANGEGTTSMLDKASSLAGDVTNVAKDAAKNVSEEAAATLDGVVESAKDATDSAVDSAKESAVAVVNTAKESVTNAVDTVMSTGESITSAAVEKSEEVVAAVAAPAAAVDTAAVDTKEGETIYKSSCNACHGAGVAGSPKLGDKDAWSARIAQGNALMTEHAIKGFQGVKGYMPPKGGAMHLSDEQIAMVVEYMVSQVQ